MTRTFRQAGRFGCLVWLAIAAAPVVPGAIAQTATAVDATTEPTDASPEGMIALIKAAPTPDAKLIAALENHLSTTLLPPDAANTVAPALNETTLDAQTLLKLLGLIGPLPEQDAVAAAAMAAIARQAPKDIADPDRVAPICRAILKTQPIMSKIAWRGDGERLKTYGEVLAIYVDHCPKDDPALMAKLADIQIRQLTAARFKLEPEAALARANAIDAEKLTRPKDRDQLNWLKMELYRKNNQPDKAGPFAKAVWENKDSEWRDAGWPVYFEWLRSSGKLTEAGALLDDVAATGTMSAEVARCRQQLAETAATQPAAP